MHKILRSIIFYSLFIQLGAITSIAELSQKVTTLARRIEHLEGSGDRLKIARMQHAKQRLESELQRLRTGMATGLEHEPDDFFMALPIGPHQYGSWGITRKGLISFMHKHAIQSDRLILVDLRGEAHLFINDIPWYLEQPPITNGPDLIAYERNLAKKIRHGTLKELKVLHKSGDYKKKVREFLPKPIPSHAQVTTEADIAQVLGIHYIRIPNEDHGCPTIDSIYAFIQSVAPFYNDNRTTILIHCNGGQGRTTFYAIVLDMLAHAHEQALDDIIAHQAQTFAASITKIKKKAQGKREILEHIYNYIKHNKDHFKTPPQPLSAECS